jgi:hypothetical protein
LTVFVSDDLFEIDTVKIVSDNDKLVSNVAKLCLCDKFSPALIHKADDLVNRKGGDLLSMVTLTESEINFIRTDTNQILSRIEDDQEHSFSVHDSCMKLI